MHPFPLEQTEGPAHGRGEGGAVNLILLERKDRSLVVIALVPKIAILHQEVYVCVVWIKWRWLKVVLAPPPQREET